MVMVVSQLVKTYEIVVKNVFIVLILVSGFTYGFEDCPVSGKALHSLLGVPWSTAEPHGENPCHGATFREMHQAQSAEHARSLRTKICGTTAAISGCFASHRSESSWIPSEAKTPTSSERIHLLSAWARTDWITSSKRTTIFCSKESLWSSFRATLTSKPSESNTSNTSNTSDTKSICSS